MSGEFIPIGSEVGGSSRPDRVVLGRQIISGYRVQLLHGLILDFDTCGERVGEQVHLYAQAGASDCRADRVEDGLEAVERVTGLIAADETEQSMFDRIPLAALRGEWATVTVRRYRSRRRCWRACFQTRGRQPWLPPESARTVGTEAWG